MGCKRCTMCGFKPGPQRGYPSRLSFKKRHGERMFHQAFTPAATPVPRRRPCVYHPEPLSALPTSYTSVPDPAPVSVSVNITGHVIMVDTDFVEIDLGREEDTQPLPPQSFLRALLSRFIRLVKRVFTSNKNDV